MEAKIFTLAPGKTCLLFAIILITYLSSCKKWIEVDPPIDAITGATVFDNVATTTSLLNNVYFKLQMTAPGRTLAMVADEVSPRIPDAYLFYYYNEYQGEDTQSIDEIWKNYYGTYLYNVNLVIEGVSSSKELSEKTKRMLNAEARFTRAFLYFYLVNLYGDVPLVLTTNYKTNANITRTPKADVLKQIISDLDYAKDNLPVTYLGSDLVTPTNNRLRPTKWAALAMLSRVYLFTKQWILAEQNCDQVIHNSNMFSLSTLDETFNKNSTETIWALQPDLQEITDASNNTVDGQVYLPMLGNLPNFIINTSLLAKFYDTDQRKLHWIGKSVDESVTPNQEYYYPHKYKHGSNFTGSFQDQQEFFIVLRLAEQYLIRAEARAQLDKLSGLNSAEEDLNIVRTRAGLSGTKATSRPEMLKAILEERQLELFSEWGHRWLDLKRTETINEVMSVETPKKGGTWNSNKALFPIPLSEFSNNPALRGHQNPGYRETR